MVKRKTQATDLSKKTRFGEKQFPVKFFLLELWLKSTYLPSYVLSNLCPECPLINAAIIGAVPYGGKILRDRLLTLKNLTLENLLFFHGQSSLIF